MVTAVAAPQPDLDRRLRSRFAGRFRPRLLGRRLPCLRLDTAVDPDYQRRGIGRALVQTLAAEATAAGCEWLHVDYEPHLDVFYRRACGFRATDAGLLNLSR